MHYELLFYILLLIVAFLYASVGHGGASGYLALMALFSFAPEIMRPAALLLNIIVSFTAFIQYYRGGYFHLRLFLPFALASIPAAFIGGLITIDPFLYKKTLGILLLFSVVRLAGLKFYKELEYKKQSMPASGLIGAIIGFFSGMIGIGGGIILSPVILLLHWANLKETAAVSSIFIFVNSLAGLAGLFTVGFTFGPEIVGMVAVAFAGGVAGSYFGALKLSNSSLKYILAIVLFMASVKLLLA